LNPEEKQAILKDWIKHKKAENTAKKKRIEIEKQLEEMYILEKNKKSTKFKEDDLGFAITVKKSESLKLDNEKYISIRDQIPADLRPEKVSFSLDEKGYNWLKENNKDVYKKISDCVELKIGKTGFTVEKL
jgi:hypothetical protein